MRRVEVCKFGGVSVGTTPNIEAVLKIIEGHKKPLVVVVSAMGGVTDSMLAAALNAAKGDLRDCEIAASQMRRRYGEAIGDLVPDRALARTLYQLVEESVSEFEAVCTSLTVIREHTPRILDVVLARGERFSAHIFTAALVARGSKTKMVDGVEVIKLSRQFNQLSPELALCEKYAQDVIAPFLEKGEVVVVPGFIGEGPDGEVRTLGRGGSDYTATILAHALDAERVTLYKEVDGMLTVDPGYVKEARVVPELHYREAAELAYYGAKVLHPRSIIPLLHHEIPLVIRSSFNPKFQGTVISGKVKSGDYPVKALTAMAGQALVAVEGKGMIGVPGIAARTFSAMAGADISVSFISQSSSEASICFVVPMEQAERAAEVLQETFKWELAHELIDGVNITKELATIAVVGLGMVGTPGIAARTFSALAQKSINIIAIAQGSSELNISFAIRSEDMRESLRALHTEYRLDKLQALPSRHGRSLELCVFGFGQIGRTLSRQIEKQKEYFRGTLQLKIRCIAIADRSGIWIEKDGLSEQQLREAIALKEGKQPLRDDDPQAKSAYPVRTGLTKLFDLPLHCGVFVDLTADDTAELVLEALSHNFHVVLANKKPLAAKQEVFDQIVGEARAKNLGLRYEATVGAGLPILDTIAKLSTAGDEVITIEGSLSGTLGFILAAVEDGKPFSEAVTEAFNLGFTEPDPREDLSGMDVARKALILARTLGLKINLDQIVVDPLYRAEQSHRDPLTFLANLRNQDEEISERLHKAANENKVLRYTAKIAKDSVTVGLTELPAHSPLGRLKGTNNQVSITTSRYRDNPLIVTGPGAGAEVTAAGVLNDLVAIALMDDAKAR